MKLLRVALVIGAGLLAGCRPEASEEPILSADANLSSLSVTGVTLTPAFTPATTSYTATAGTSTQTVTVRARSADAGATISVNGTPVAQNVSSPPIPVVVGPNTIVVSVVSQNQRNNRTYTLLITRVAGAPQA